MTLGSWRFLLFNVIILLVMIFCYGRILVAIRRQARVMAAHRGPAGSNAAHDQSHRIQTNLVKTMILVCVLYATTWAPLCIYSLLKIFRLELTIGEYGLYNVLYFSSGTCTSALTHSSTPRSLTRLDTSCWNCFRATKPYNLSKLSTTTDRFVLGRPRPICYRTVVLCPSVWITLVYFGQTVLLANVNVSSRSLIPVARPSVVCLSSVCRL